MKGLVRRLSGPTRRCLLLGEDVILEDVSAFSGLDSNVGVGRFAEVCSAAQPVILESSSEIS